MTVCVTWLKRLKIKSLVVTDPASWNWFTLGNGAVMGLKLVDVPLPVARMGGSQAHPVLNLHATF